MSGRSRTTRLSSGSTKKRNYAEGLTSSDEDDAAGTKKRGKQRADSEPDDDSGDSDVYEQPKKQKNGAGSRNSGNGRRKSGVRDESVSSDEFVDEEEDEEEDADEGEDVDEDEDEDEAYESKARSTKGKGKGTPRNTKSSSSQEPRYGASQVVEMARAPKEKASPNQISEHTLAFMRDMQDPQKNDREWFAQHKDVYDYINANWLAFTATCVDRMIDEADDTIGWMQPKDLVERIYRDVRFSNDKTPYKRHLSWCMGRAGRKGTYAKYYFALSANNKSGLHAGLYEVDKDNLQAVRQHLLERSRLGNALRDLVQRPEFIAAFGSAPKTAKSTVVKRASLWGSDDELKRSPKGYDPDHPDALWLRLKSYTVSHSFTDAEVLQPNFISKIIEIARAAQPLVEIMNEIVHGAPPADPSN